ncbi:MAG: 1-deoxy-D-xylulose-5-phosphate reductoisomerase [Lachnospiraceae bacterium]|nr:1-deoxy-D-xylulose-5-phosphate reductoisomerase [Lachnospiraceae bacterium]
MRNIAILGATGSIGTQTLSVVREREDVRVVSLSAYSDVALLEKETREFNPELVCMVDENAALDLRARLRDLPVRVVSGMEGLVETAVHPSADLMVGAVVGTSGILPTIEAIRAGKDIAIANKETLVSAGHIIMPLVKERGVKLLPVDSEHSAIFQCLEGERENAVSRILLTCSGGPFRGYTKEMLSTVTKEQALHHPRWKMGPKVTIDSSTLANKGLEVMEARWLFDVPYEKIEVVIHPESIVHSMVEFEDGAVKAQLGLPDMRTPIAYALSYPHRKPLSGGRLDFGSLSGLSFEKPDTAVFSALRLAVEAGIRGGNAPTVFNTADECAVKAFMAGRIPYTGISTMIEEAMAKIPFIADPDLQAVFETERAVREVYS